MNADLPTLGRLYTRRSQNSKILRICAKVTFQFEKTTADPWILSNGIICDMLHCRTILIDLRRPLPRMAGRNREAGESPALSRNCNPPTRWKARTPASSTVSTSLAARRWELIPGNRYHYAWYFNRAYPFSLSVRQGFLFYKGRNLKRKRKEKALCET